MYTTISKVRELSGFDDSTKISDSVILGKIHIAESMMDAAVSQRYSLPLDYHRQNTITFSGTGTGSDTMSIIINGVTYAIAITSGLTAAGAADLFRTACDGSAHFITDLAWGTASVVIISITDSDSLSTANAEVNITNAGGTVEGVTGTAGSRIDRYPQIVDQITAEIAAALLLQDNYGIEAEDTPKDGDRRLENIKKTLAQLQGTDKDFTLHIIDEVTKAELASGGSEMAFYPNDTSKEDDDDPTEAKIAINDEF